MVKNINRLISTILVAASVVACRNAVTTEQPLPEDAFIRIDGQNLIKPDGTKLYIVGPISELA